VKRRVALFVASIFALTTVILVGFPPPAMADSVVVDDSLRAFDFIEYDTSHDRIYATRWASNQTTVEVFTSVWAHIGAIDMPFNPGPWTPTATPFGC
jgi:hypothetical protein